MKNNLIFTISLLLIAGASIGFCGFYVAQAGAELYNNKSEVILVRDGKKTTITMSNDFEGNVKDFAMVIPVPNVLKRNDIRIVDRSVFKQLDRYSAPRLTEYYDENPCYSYEYEVVEDNLFLEKSLAPTTTRNLVANRSGVTIEAQYSVEEYEILILSAKESNGLKDWLVSSGYSIPENAEEVLEPYIKNGLKFFVVKVNLNEYDPSAHGGYLRPIQIDVTSDNFMLPIRLGMANAEGAQDMLVYAFTRTGRVESTNYRTVEMPSNRNVPTFVKTHFGEFYADVFDRSYLKEGRNVVFQEYAWNVTPSWSGVKCDPCVGNPPMVGHLQTAGVKWSSEQNAQVFFTRLHVRYTRDKFPEDLFFQETPNKTHFQCRYYIRHPATGDLSCDAGQLYVKDLRERRANELVQLVALTGWKTEQFMDYIFAGETQFENIEKGASFTAFDPGGGSNGGGQTPVWLFFMSTALLASYSVNLLYKRLKRSRSF